MFVKLKANDVIHCSYEIKNKVSKRQWFLEVDITCERRDI